MFGYINKAYLEVFLCECALQETDNLTHTETLFIVRKKKGRIIGVFGSGRMEEECKCLPGFRFHPTEEELLSFYLKSMVLGKNMRGDVIGFLNIYNYHPNELPRKQQSVFVS